MYLKPPHRKLVAFWADKIKSTVSPYIVLGVLDFVCKFVKVLFVFLPNNYALNLTLFSDEFGYDKIFEMCICWF